MPLNVLLAVSVVSPLAAQDQRLSDILTTAGHTVTAQLSTTALPDTGYNVCVVTESGSSGSAANTSVPTCLLPVVHMETNWNTSRMATVAATTPANTGSLNIIATSHPIVAGFTSPITIRTVSTGSMYGVASTALPAGVVNVAEHSVTGGHCVVAAADTGATLTTGTAPARRVELGQGIGGTGVSTWSTDGDTLFRQAVEWAGATAGQSIAMGLATEADTAQPAPYVKKTQFALPFTVTKSGGAKNIAMGLATGTGTAQPFTVRKNPIRVPMGLATTTSTALGFTSGPVLPALVDGVEPEATGSFHGPIADSNGTLYVVQEEYLGAGGAGLGNHPQLMRSGDQGATWTRPDAASGPGYGVSGSYNDIESAWLLHLPAENAVLFLYEKAQSRWWAVKFRTSDHPTNPDTWDSSSFATSGGIDTFASGSQAAESGISGATLSDGRARAFVRGTPQGGFESFLTRERATNGTWGASSYITDSRNMTRPAAVAAGTTTYLFYRDDTNGQVRYRTINSSGTVSASARVDSGGAGTGANYVNNVVPPVYYDDAGTDVAVVGFVNASNQLRTVEVRGGTVGSEQVVSTDTVTVNPQNNAGSATDNQGPSAALAVVGTTLYALWGDNTSGDLYYATRANGGTWSARTLLADTGSGGSVHWLYAKANVQATKTYVTFLYDIGPHADDDSNTMYARLGPIDTTPAGLTGALAGTLPALASATTGQAVDSGAPVGTLPTLTAALAGQARVTGAPVVTLPSPLTAVLTGQAVDSGALAVTLPSPLTASLTGQTRVTGAPAATLPALTSSITGSITVVGAVAAVLPSPLASSISGSVTVVGAVAGTLPSPLTTAISGSVGFPSISGAFAGTLPTLTAAATGQAVAGGALAGTLPSPLTAALTAQARVTGSPTAVLPTLTASATGQVRVTGAPTAVLPALTATLTGQSSPPGTLSGVLPTITGAFTATNRITAALAPATLPALTSSVAASVPVTGQATGLLGPLSGTFSGSVTVSGTIVGTLSVLTAALTGTSTGIVSLLAVLPGLSGALQGAVRTSGALAGTLPPLSGAATGETGALAVYGALSANLPALRAAGGAEVVVAAAFTVSLPSLRAFLLVGEVPLPENRTYLVPGEDRGWVVPADYRRAVVLKDQRRSAVLV